MDHDDTATPLRPLARDLFALESVVSLDRLGLVRFPVRTLVIRTDAGLVVHAPFTLTDAIAHALDSLGEVSTLIAPNLFHHLRLGDWIARYPSARVWAPSALRKKRPDLRVDATLDAETDAMEGAARTTPSEDLFPVAVEGIPELDETVFLHAPSRTLIVTDLVFNMVTRPPGLLTGLVLRMVGAHGRCAQSRLIGMLTKDALAAASSYERVLALDFDRVVPAHGEVIEGQTNEDARAILRRGLERPLSRAARTRKALPA